MIKVNSSKWEYLKESSLERNLQRLVLLAITFAIEQHKLLLMSWYIQDTRNVYHSIIIFLKVVSKVLAKKRTIFSPEAS